MKQGGALPPLFLRLADTPCFVWLTKLLTFISACCIIQISKKEGENRMSDLAKMIKRVKNAALKELRQIVLDSLLDESVLSDTCVEDLAEEVIRMVGTERMSEELYQKQYELGFKDGLCRVVTWMTEEQLKSHYEDLQDYGEFGALPKEIGKECAYVEGYHSGARTGHWFNFNRKEEMEAAT